MINYTNKTGSLIEIETIDGGIFLENNDNVTLDTEISKNDIIVYNDSDCEVFIDSGYINSDGIGIVNIYID